MKGFPPWPGKVIQPDDSAAGRSSRPWVFFFGSHNFASVAPTALQPFLTAPTATRYRWPKNLKVAMQEAEDELTALTEETRTRLSRMARGEAAQAVASTAEHASAHRGKRGRKRKRQSRPKQATAGSRDSDQDPSWSPTGRRPDRVSRRAESTGEEEGCSPQTPQTLPEPQVVTEQEHASAHRGKRGRKRKRQSRPKEATASSREVEPKSPPRIPRESCSPGGHPLRSRRTLRSSLNERQLARYSNSDKDPSWSPTGRRPDCVSRRAERTGKEEGCSPQTPRTLPEAQVVTEREHASAHRGKRGRKRKRQSCPKEAAAGSREADPKLPPGSPRESCSPKTPRTLPEPQVVTERPNPNADPHENPTELSGPPHPNPEASRPVLPDRIMAPASAKGKIFRETLVLRKRRAGAALSPVAEQDPVVKQDPAVKQDPVVKLGLLCGSDQRCSPAWLHLVRAVAASPRCAPVLLGSSCPDSNDADLQLCNTVRTPLELAEERPAIIFCFFSERWDELRRVLLDPSKGLLATRFPSSLVVLSSMSPALAKRVHQELSQRAWRLLESPLLPPGRGTPSSYSLLASGSASLFSELEGLLASTLQLRFRAIFLGDRPAGYASRIADLLLGLQAVCTAALAETVALSKRLGVEEDLMRTAKATEMTGAPEALIDGSSDEVPLDAQQRHLKTLLSMADEVSQPLSVTAAANELYKSATGKRQW